MQNMSPIDWDQVITDPSLPPAQAPIPETNFLENLEATRREMEIAGNTNAESVQLEESYRPIIEELERAGSRYGPNRLHYLNPASLADRPSAAYNMAIPSREEMETAIWQEIGRIRQANPGFLLDAGTDANDFRRRTRDRYAAELQSIRRTQQGATGMGTLGGFVGGMAGTLQDPFVIATLPVGGASRTWYGAVGREFVENALLQALTEPLAAQHYQELGEDYGFGDAARSILFAGGAGAGFRGVIEGARFGVRNAGAGYDSLLEGVFNAMPESVQRRWADAATVDDRLLTDMLRETVPEADWTPELRSAVNVIEREAEVRDASPFEPGPVGDQAHADSLSGAMDRIIAGAPPIRADVPFVPTPARISTVPAAANGGPATVAAELRSAGLPPNVVAGFLGNFEVEGGYRGAVGDSGSAFGIAQWRNERVSNFERVIGVHPRLASHAMQARFVRWEMDNPEAAGMTVEQRDAILRAQSPEEAARLIDQYYERSSGTHRERRVEAARRYADDPAAAVEMAEVAPPVRLDEPEPEVIVEREDDFTPTREEADFEPVPVLRRDMFANDNEWAVAQNAYYRFVTEPEFDPARLVFPPQNTRGRGVFFHGARGEVPELTEGYYNPANIYGGFDTFYTTDAVDIASGYGRRSRDSRVYEVAERSPVRMFDMEEDRPINEINALFGVGPDDIGFVPGAIETTARDGKAKLREVMDEIREESAGEGVSRDEVQEYFDTAIYNLRQQGFGGMEHVGGLKTGRTPHTARIYFDAPNQLELKDVTPQRYAELERVEPVRPMPEPNPDPVALEAERVALEAPDLARFDDPTGEGPRTHADSLEHDILADIAADPALAAREFIIDETGKETLGEILEEIEGDRAAIAALRGCL